MRKRKYMLKINNLQLFIISICIVVIVILLSQVGITKQKYEIIMLNQKIDKTNIQKDDLEMEKSRLMSKDRLRDIAINKNNMTPIEDYKESIKATILE